MCIGILRTLICDLTLGLRLFFWNGENVDIDAQRHDGSTVIDGLIAGAEKGFFEPARLLRLATTDTARMIFPQQKAGCLEPGCEASFLVLDGDPLENFSNIRNIRLRVKEGQLLTPEEIQGVTDERN